MSILSWNAFYLFLFLWWGGGVRHTDRTTWTKLYNIYLVYVYSDKLLYFLASFAYVCVYELLVWNGVVSLL